MALPATVSLVRSGKPSSRLETKEEDFPNANEGRLVFRLTRWDFRNPRLPTKRSPATRRKGELFLINEGMALEALSQLDLSTSGRQILPHVNLHKMGGFCPPMGDVFKGSWARSLAWLAAAAPLTQ